MRINNQEQTYTYEIIPGILEKDWEEIEKKIQVSLQSTNHIHIDLLDGKFADNTTWLDAAPFKKYTHQGLFEVHLMVDDPIKYIDPFAEAGFKRFIGHVEKMQDQVAFVTKAEEVGEVGLAVDIDTPIDAITVDYEDLDLVFLMSVKAGFSRQEFDSAVLEKIKAVRSKDAFMPIQIDGGVNLATLMSAKNAGATRFVTTKYFFDDPHPEDEYKRLLEATEPRS